MGPPLTRAIARSYFERVNVHCDVLDPVLHTPASTFARCPFLFTVGEPFARRRPHVHPLSALTSSPPAAPRRPRASPRDSLRDLVAVLHGKVGHLPDRDALREARGCYRPDRWLEIRRIVPGLYSYVRVRCACSALGRRQKLALYGARYTVCEFN